MTHKRKDSHRPPEDALWFLPLGGSGEIGMNLSLYGTAGKWLMVDCGITFPDDMTPGIEVIMPDISFIADRRDDLVGLVLTHGHEDHLGAVEYLWQHLRCPVYTTPFTAGILRSKLSHSGQERSVRIIEQPIGCNFTTGPFSVEMIHVTHSIPEAHMLLITTPCAKVLHTGDWKLDPDPVIGPLTDEARLKRLGNEKVTALVGDSTNAPVPGRSGSEMSAREGLDAILGRWKHRVAVTCFASNVARIKSIAAAAAKHGRKTALVGRSLWRNSEIAEACGYLPEFNDFLEPAEAMRLPKSKVLLICTGCQGEQRAALSRIASQDHPEVKLDKGDAVIFSSRDIPGNERAIGRTQNLLIKNGVEVITSHEAPVHVSGHPCRDEVADLYRWVKPKFSVPVHGELRHQTAHARIAAECGVSEIIIAENGMTIDLSRGAPAAVARAHHGRIGMDGRVLRTLAGDTLKHRRRLSNDGALVVTLAIDGRGKLAGDPQLSIMGLDEGEYLDDMRDELAAEIRTAVRSLGRRDAEDDDCAKKAVMKAVRHLLTESHGKRPMIEIHLVRV